MMLSYACVKKNGLLMDPVRVVGLAVEKAHKTGRQFGWGSVKPGNLTSVSHSGAVHVLRGGSNLFMLDCYFGAVLGLVEIVDSTTLLLFSDPVRQL